MIEGNELLYLDICKDTGESFGCIHWQKKLAMKCPGFVRVDEGRVIEQVSSQFEVGVPSEI